MDEDWAYAILEQVESYLEGQSESENDRAHQLAHAVGEILTWLESL
jgi:hypothetical protein